MIHQITHVTKASSSCIDLIFTTHLNLIKKSDFEMSLFDKCRDSIIFDKLCFRIPLSPPYFIKVWDYKNVDVKNIQQSIADIDLFYKILIGFFTR